MSAEAVVTESAPKPSGQQYVMYLIGDRVLIRRDAAPEQIGGIAVPDAVREEHRLLEGEVLMTGPDCKQVQPADRAIYGAFNGQKIEVNGEELLILNEPEVLAAWRIDDRIGEPPADE